MDENVHRSAYVVCLGQCGWVLWFGIFDSSLAINYRTFGSDRQKLVDNAATCQWHHYSMTSVFIDAQLRRSAPHTRAQFWRLSEIWTAKCCWPSFRPLKGTSLRHSACFEPCASKSAHRVTLVGEPEKTIGVIFNVFGQVFHYNRLAQILGYVFVSWITPRCLWEGQCGIHRMTLTSL